MLAFRTFAYIRSGSLLGQLLVDNDLAAVRRHGDAGSTRCCATRAPRGVDARGRAVAEEIAADPRYADEEQLGPTTRPATRFRAFARKQLGEQLNRAGGGESLT